MLVIKYTDDTGTTVDITDRFDLTDGLTVMTSAEETAKDSSNVTAQDPDDDFAISGHRGFFVHEDTAPFERIGIFFTNTRTYSRDTVWYTEGSHNVAINLDDVNTLLSRQILRTFDRPAETDVERLAALLATTEMSFIGDPTTYVDTSGPIAMDAQSYIGQSTQNVIQDCMDSSGKNAYCFQTFDSPDYVTAFWYGFGGSTERSSDLRITNYLPDVDADAGAGDPGSGAAWTWGPLKDAELARDPTRVYSGVFANYDGGAVFVEHTATALAFAHRHTVVNWPNVKSSAAAIARANRYLNDINTEEDVITVTIEVSPAHVNDAREGERIECLFTHLPGYESDYTWMRIMHRTVRWVTPAVYRITYVLSATPIVPAACSTALSGNQTWIGHFYTDAEGGGGGYTSPFSDTPDDPSNVPGVTFLGWTVRRIGDVMGTGNSTTIGGDYTQLWNTRQDDVGNWQTIAALAYNANTGDAGTGSFAWTPNPASTHRAYSVTIATNSTTPVQVSPMFGSGSNVTLDNPPTVGNILIAQVAYEQATGSPGTVPAGWVLLGWAQVDGNFLSQVMGHCVDEDDTDTFLIMGSSFNHWGAIVEWAIT